MAIRGLATDAGKASPMKKQESEEKPMPWILRLFVTTASDAPDEQPVQPHPSRFVRLWRRAILELPFSIVGVWLVSSWPREHSVRAVLDGCAIYMAGHVARESSFGRTVTQGGLLGALTGSKPLNPLRIARALASAIGICLVVGAFSSAVLATSLHFTVHRFVAFWVDLICLMAVLAVTGMMIDALWLRFNPELGEPVKVKV